MITTLLERDPDTGDMVVNLYLDGVLISSVPATADEEPPAEEPEPAN
jgi:hypothetical protein